MKADHDIASPGDALLEYYEALESASQNMLDAARNGDWQGVAQNRTMASLLVAQLRRRLHDSELDRHEVRRKLRIMRRIVCNDAELRALEQPWARTLELLLSGRRSS